MVLGLDLQGQIGAAQGQRGHDALIRELPGKALPYRDVWHAFGAYPSCAVRRI